jgi:hypothetical protein
MGFNNITVMGFGAVYLYPKAVRFLLFVDVFEAVFYTGLVGCLGLTFFG